ncbi:MAG: outer membrane protein [Desulfobaccales bacterium]
MKKKTYVVGVAVLLAALLALAGVAQSAMWVGAELGANFPANSDITVNGFDTGSTAFSPTVIGGATIGYDFVNAGFGGYAWPDWMKYFSILTDVTYNKLQMSTGRDASGLGGLVPGGTQVEGSALAWTWMLMAHYGFLPDSEIPTGRVNPYIGVGPAIVWTTLDASSASFSNATSTNIALVAEAGIRWVCFKQVSVDTAYRFRYLEPSWDASDVTIKAPLYMHTFLVRANYHF